MSETRDWTFVLHEACPECGVDVQTIPQAELASRLHDSIDEWTALLIGPDVNPTQLMTRPDPTTWSTVEYACHVADVIDLFQHRIFLMISEDNPQFDSFDPDAAATQYGQRSPQQAAALLQGAANRLGDVFEALAPHLWDSTGLRADGAPFTVLSLSRYFMHDNLHHLNDVSNSSNEIGRSNK
jgi:DinB superfamily